MNSHDAMPVPSTSRRTTLSFEAVFSETALASDGRQIKRQRRQAANSDNWLRKLDRCQVLGDGSERHHYTEIPHYGHLGCVNALAWSPDGTMLASGSDDFRVCLWKLGQAPNASDPVNDVEGFWPGLGIGLQAIVHTGHTRNIFSVKWAPHCNNSRLLSCAGDARVKVFDISRTDSLQAVQHKGQSWNEFSNGSALLHQFRCHTDRVKRISTEDSPDCFLTVSEDATVRQFDLREKHICDVPARVACPVPLADYSSQGISLYTLSVSKLRPELFVCGGTSSFAYLHDRRMGRSMLAEWGVPLQKDVTSQCVRRFSLNDPAAAGGRPDRRHITAAKLSEVNGRELAVSYSEGPVALFDIFDDAVEMEVPVEVSSKRKRSDTSVQEAERPAKMEKTPETTDPGSVFELRRTLVVSFAFDRPNLSFPALHFVFPWVDQLLALDEMDAGARICKAYCYLLESDSKAARKELALVPDDARPSNFDTLCDLLSSDATHPRKLRSYRFGLASAAALAELWPDMASLIKVEPNLPLTSAEVEEDDLEIGDATSETASEDDDSLSQEEESISGSDEMIDAENATFSDDEEASAQDELRAALLRKRAEARHGTNSTIPLVLPKLTYEGHRNRDTVKDVEFGFLDEFVLSGSDDGRLFVFDKKSTEIVQILEGDQAVVNVAQAHPSLPILAVSGIDSSIKIFAPTSAFPRRFSALADKDAIIQANQSARRRQDFLAPDVNFMSVLAARIMSQQDVNGPEGARQGPVMLTPAELRRLMQEEGQDDNCIIT